MVFIVKGNCYPIEIGTGYLNEHVKQANRSLAPYEQLKRCEILNAEWSIDGGELTPKLSLKRKIIKEKYKSAIENIFSVD